ncbi:uncharacterized protein LOC115628107 [Scaptodrosophila lebanonensis]|uniref:Uncharacterized protein LOC115628107 n=1 Tax=Drosophila lebanonensis TaxID=7225 RepID=A0A6J2TWM2_DROLE|nr:uncharacterized protein LOC115628107 [Scaptodrosophila lebanonensis]
MDFDKIEASVSKNLALNICIRSLDLNKAPVDVLSLWLKKLLRAYISAPHCDLTDVFKSMHEWFQRLKEQAVYGDIINILVDAIEFADWANNLLLNAEETLVHTASYFLLAIVHCILQFYVEHNIQDLKEHLPNAIKLHLLVISLLKEVTARSVKVNDGRVTILIRQLCEICELLSTKIIHMTVFLKTSKIMTYICIHYCRLSEYESNPEWLNETQLHLCDTVLNNLETIKKKETLTVSLEKVEDFLKMTQAYLIMLHNIFSTGVKNVEESVLEVLLAVLMGGDTKPTHDLGKDVPALLNKFVRLPTMKIFELIYHVGAFQKYMLDALSQPEASTIDFFQLCLDFVTVVIMDDKIITPSTCETVQMVFEFVFKDEWQFINRKHYDRIIEAYGTLVYVGNSLQLCNYFCAGVFQDDVLKSQASADVLLCSFKIVEANNGWNNGRMQPAIDYWNQCNNSYAMWSHNCSQWHVRRILNYLYTIKISNQLPMFNLNNYRLLRCISAGSDGGKSKVLVEGLQKLSMTPIKQAEQYYEMIALVEILIVHKIGQRDLKILEQSLIKLKSLLESDKCILLINVIAKLALKSNRFTQFGVLQKFARTAAVASWHFQKFIHKCRHSDNETLKSLSSDVVVQKTDCTTLLDTLLNSENRCYNNKGVDNMYRKLCYTRSRNHRCNKSCLKRKRDTITPKHIINELYTKSVELDQCDAQSLDRMDKEKLKSIITNIQRYLQE